jgi:chemotaxis protein MotB
MEMNRKRRIVCVILLTLSLIVIGSCVSKKDYLLKVEEEGNLSKELAALRSEHNKLEEEKEALDKQTIALQEEKNALEAARSHLNEDNKDQRQNLEILKMDANNFRDQIAALQEKNKTLQSEATALERQKEEQMRKMRGTYEDLLADMKSEIENGKITITQLRGKLKVNMLDEILFDSGKITIKPQGVEVLDRVGNILLNVKDRAINIEGHTDNVPIGADLSKQYPTNWELSAARATNVARYLQEKTGINPSLLSATGYGQYQPIASNETEEGRAKNRRIEIVLVPKEIVPVSRK